MSPKKLLGLDAFNAQRSEAYREANSNKPRPNGIACPKCGAELEDTAPMVTLTSWPTQKNVGCPRCHYVGYRIA